MIPILVTLQTFQMYQNVQLVERKPLFLRIETIKFLNGILTKLFQIYINSDFSVYNVSDDEPDDGYFLGFPECSV